MIVRMSRLVEVSVVLRKTVRGGDSHYLTNSLSQHYTNPDKSHFANIYYSINKCSVLRRQSRDTNRNIKRSVYCQYG